MADLREMVEFLDEYLDVAGTPDYPGAWNGLQVDCRSPIECVRVATDACQATIEAAARDEAQLLVVHHGLFWGEPLPVTGRTYRRLKALLDADLALYSAHLPLDVHPEVGNSSLLARELDLVVEGRFGAWNGLEGLGVWAATDLSLQEVVARVESACGAAPTVLTGGPGHVRRVGIATGAAASLIPQAHAEGLDTFITGEGSHHTYHDAMELGVNVIYAGHYATETAGVKAVGELLTARYGVDASFIDHPTGL